jgi:hypothetical protein
MNNHKLKVAVCLSGEMRFFTDELVTSAFQTYIQSWSPDIFISTWDHVGISMNHGYIHPKEIKEREDTLHLHINNTYSNIKAVEIENYNEWIDNIPESEYSIVYSDSFYTRTINSYPQLYKIYKANKLKIDYEEKEKFKYDIVLRIRPDNLFIRPLALNQVVKGVIYDVNLKGAYYPNRIYDIFFYGCSEDMDIVSSAYVSFKELLYSSFNNGLCPRDACRLLYLHAINAGLVCESTKNRPCDIYRGQTFEEYCDLLQSWGGLD